MRGCFVTATGTEVGKTLVTAALACQLVAQGRSVAVRKPVLSGYTPERAEESDPGVLLRALGEPVSEARIEELTPWRFAAPLSPDMAAAREGRGLDLNAIVGFCRSALDGPDDVVLIEGVGGAMVPLDDGHTVLDWISALGLPALVVAGSYLGTISHTLTTLEALHTRKVEIAGLVLSESPESPVPLAETAAAVARFAPEPPLAMIPRLPGPTPWQRAPDLTFLLDRPSRSPGA